MIEAQAIAVPSRRGFIAGALALVAAPAIIKVSSLMPVNTRLVPGDDLGALRLINEFRVENEAISRLDVLFGSMQRPEWNFAVGHAVNRLTAQNEITREAVRLFQNSNEFIKKIDAEYERDYAFMKGQWAYNKERRSLDRVDPQRMYSRPNADVEFPPIDKLALAVAAPVVVAKALEQPVTRRFWGNRSKNDG